MFIAQSLVKRQSPPDVTIFMNNWGMYEAYRQRKKRLSISYDGLGDGLRGGVDTEVLTGGQWYLMPRNYGENTDKMDRRVQGEQERPQKTDEHIDCLVVACKSNHAFSGVRALRRRLSANSTIMLVQNGLGVAERLNQLIFKDPKARPQYLHAPLTHGLDKKDMYQIKYRQVGTTNIAPPPTSGISLAKPEDDTSGLPSTKYLTRLFTLTPSLIATANTPTNVLMYQLEKLAINSVIEPLTALNDAQHGQLLYIESVSRIMRLLLFEISRVIVALPELQGVPGLEDRFQPERLRRLIVNQLNRTPKNTSPMLHDVRSRKGTEIEYLNGYIVRRGQELGITCVMNYMVKHMVHAKQQINLRSEVEAIPIDASFEEEDSVQLTGKHLQSVPQEKQTREDSWSKPSEMP